MKLLSFFLFLTIPFISKAQDKCISDYICKDSKYCGDDMTCFCSNGICKYGPGPISKISKISNISNISIGSLRRHK